MITRWLGGSDPTKRDSRNSGPCRARKDLNGDGKVEIWENWRAVSTSLVRTDKVDLMSLSRDPLTNGIIYDSATGPQSSTVSPLATFKAAFVQNDPAVPTNTGAGAAMKHLPPFRRTLQPSTTIGRQISACSYTRSTTGNGADPNSKTVRWNTTRASFCRAAFRGTKNKIQGRSKSCT